MVEWRESSAMHPPQFGSAPAQCENKFLHLEFPKIFHFSLSLFFFLQPVRTEEPLSQLTHRGTGVHMYFYPLFLLWGKSPETPQSPRPSSLFNLPK